MKRSAGRVAAQRKYSKGDTMSQVGDIDSLVAPRPASPAPAAPIAGTLFERALVWERCAAALERAKTDETAARDALLAADFADRKFGTTALPLPDGRLVKCTAEQRYKIGEPEARACVATLAALGADGRVLAERLFKFEPKVMVGELKKLPEGMRKIADAAIVVTPARPSIEIVEAPRA